MLLVPLTCMTKLESYHFACEFQIKVLIKKSDMEFIKFNPFGSKYAQLMVENDKTIVTLAFHNN